MASYIEQLLAQTSGAKIRNNKRKASIQDLLTAVAPTPAAPVATPVAGGGGQHAMSDGHGHGSQGEVNGLNAEFNNNLQRLIKASGGKVKIGSGYRSIAQQQVLYDRWLRKVPGQAKAAPPGKSNHNHGLAADLQYASPEARRWVHANAAAYGLRFPMSYEPWHIEPINARSMRK